MYIHACVCKLQFLLITQCLIADTCLSAYGADQRQEESHKRRVDYPTISSRGAALALLSLPLVAKPETGPSPGHQHQMAEPEKRAGEISGEEEMRGGEMRKKRMESAGVWSDH